MLQSTEMNVCVNIWAVDFCPPCCSYDGAFSELVFYCCGLLGAVNHQQRDRPHVWGDTRISIGQCTLSMSLYPSLSLSVFEEKAFYKRGRKNKTPSFIVSLGTQLIMPETKLISNANLLGKQSMGEWGKRTSCPHFQACLEEQGDPIKAAYTRWNRN